MTNKSTNGGKPNVAKQVAEKPAAKPVPVVAAVVPKPVPVAAATQPAVKAAPAPETPKISPPAAVTAEPSAKPVPAPEPVLEKKEISPMATTIPPKPQAAAEKVTSMIADFNDRAKSAFEKTAKASEELTEFTKGNVEALQASAKTAAKGAETIGQELADYSKKSFESATATFKSLAGVKTPTELFQIQSDYAKASFDSAVAEASKLSEAWLKLAGEIVQPLSSRYAVAAEKFKAPTL